MTLTANTPNRCIFPRCLTGLAHGTVVGNQRLSDQETVYCATDTFVARTAESHGTCAQNQSLSAMMGNQNCHAEIIFFDDVKWLARFRIARTLSPPRENTCIPTPKIFDWACESDPENMLGVGYILMEKLGGKSLDWQAANLEQKEKIMRQLVDMFLEIERHPFNAIGSLFSSAGDTIFVHGLAHQSIFRDIVGSLLENVPPGDQFFLKHPDDKGDHILVNDSFDILGVIDWEWTWTVPKAEAFCSPCMMWPVAEIYDGSNELAADELRLAAIFLERGREDLANCVLNGRKVQRFLFGLGLKSSFLDMETIPRLFKGLQRTFNLEDEDWETWKNKALKKWKDDEFLLKLLARE
ncbi:uncharacterized protein N7459_005425 [Penicillium hispanicum]|uniref:uncharacterized protein n=1 Tax=Penicillium hispanicum TaxID=1080232 RepID=UPI002541E219|nr:uncharacterized protein N7459_005425 [Penicillium hispanicum]KAJ5585625.1 hypothetical protein N7459_005425 [Penicillium hispanicum]